MRKTDKHSFNGADMPLQHCLLSRLQEGPAAGQPGKAPLG